MNAPDNLKEQMRERTDDQLRAALAAPDDWLPEALEAIQAELRRRGLDPTKPAATPAVTESAENINRQILAELRRLRRNSELGAYITIVMLVLGAGYLDRRVRQLPQSSRLARQVEELEQMHRPRPSAQGAQPLPWDEVSDAMDRFDYPKAVSLLQALIARQPTYYYGYAYLGTVYVAMGDFTNAEAQYLRACELFPDEENEKTLAVIRKRLARERGLASPSK